MGLFLFMFKIFLDDDIIAIVIKDGLYSVRKRVQFLVKQLVIPVLIALLGNLSLCFYNTVFEHIPQVFPALVYLLSQIILVILTEVGSTQLLDEPPCLEILLFG